MYPLSYMGIGQAGNGVSRASCAIVDGGKQHGDHSDENGDANVTMGLLANDAMPMDTVGWMITMPMTMRFHGPCVRWRWQLFDSSVSRREHLGKVTLQ